MSPRRIAALLVCAVVAAVPAVLGLMGNQSFSREVAVRVPPQVSVAAPDTPAGSTSPPPRMPTTTQGTGDARVPEPGEHDSEQSHQPSATRTRTDAEAPGTSSTKQAGASIEGEDGPHAATSSMRGHDQDAAPRKSHDDTSEPDDDSGGSGQSGSGQSGSGKSDSSDSGRRHGSGAGIRGGSDD